MGKQDIVQRMHQEFFKTIREFDVETQTNNDGQKQNRQHFANLQNSSDDNSLSKKRDKKAAGKKEPPNKETEITFKRSIFRLFKRFLKESFSKPTWDL